MALSKAVLRTQARARMQHLATDAALQTAVQGHVLRFLEAQAARCIAAFWPRADEVDLRPVIAALVPRGWTIGLPVVMPGTKVMTFRRWQPGDALVPHKLGMMEPVSDAPVIQPQIILAPVLAYDRTGHRLGRGGGYYDATLAALDPRPLYVGIGFSAQRFDRVPKDVHDMRLDCVIMENGVDLFKELG